jgi:hypothetical protein
MEMTNSLHRLVRRQEARMRESEEKEEVKNQRPEDMSPSRKAIHDLFQGAKAIKAKVTHSA